MHIASLPVLIIKSVVHYLHIYAVFDTFQVPTVKSFHFEHIVNTKMVNVDGLSKWFINMVQVNVNGKWGKVNSSRN